MLNKNENSSAFPVRALAARCLFAFCLLGPATKGVSADYEKAGEGEEVLWSAHRNKRDLSSLESALRNNGTPVSLALAAAASWIRYQKSLEGVDLAPLTDLVTERGLRDEVALMLAFHDDLDNEKFRTLFDRLASHSSPEVTHLAAAMLSTAHLFRYISDPEVYESPHLDQLRIMRRAHEQEAAFPGHTSDVDTSPRMKIWTRNMKVLPAIPDAWFAGGDRTLVTLAMVAAAFEGDVGYAEAMTRLDGGTGAAAGARLLYLVRQEVPPGNEEVARMFTDAFRSPPSPQIIARPSRGPESVDLYSAEIPGGVLACMALGELADPATRPLLLKALAAGDAPVKMEALRALRRMEANDKVQGAFAGLLSEAPGLLLPDLCAAIATHPDERLIPPLLIRLKNETGRFRLDLAWALGVLSGDVQGETPGEWIDWWRKNRETFELDPEASEAFRRSRAPQTLPMPATGRFYGLSIYSDHLVYVVDSSESMQGSRIDSLRVNLAESLKSFEFYRERREGAPGDMWYNMVDFGSDLVSMEPGKLVNDPDDGVKRAETVPLTLGTRSLDALWEASRIPGVDTLYFLSDGSPVLGQVDKWPRINSMLLMMYWHRPIAVWSVAFEAGKINSAHMRGISYMNFGLFEDL